MAYGNMGFLLMTMEKCVRMHVSMCGSMPMVWESDFNNLLGTVRCVHGSFGSALRQWLWRLASITCSSQDPESNASNKVGECKGA